MKARKNYISLLKALFEYSSTPAVRQARNNNDLMCAKTFATPETEP